MKLYKVGDKSQALCAVCKAKQPTTFEERTVPFRSRKGSVPDLLVAVCDKCDTIVGIPQQSVPRIHDTLKRSRHSMEARVPRHLMDGLSCFLFNLGSNQSGSSVLLRYYINELHHRPPLQTRIVKLAKSAEAKGKKTVRISAKLNDDIFAKLQSLRKSTGLSTTELIKGLLVHLVSDKPKNDSKLREILNIAA